MPDMAVLKVLEFPCLQKLQSVEQIELLDVFDSLSAQGVSVPIEFPQLVVCGDRSSGKSSVLEAISGIPFPKHENISTRFATEVILRRAPRDEILVSIVPGKGRAQPDVDRLLEFGHNLKTNDGLGGLFVAAENAMGLSPSESSPSNDILRIELRGPSQPQFTLVDLPGLIDSKAKSQTTDDAQLVDDLVLQYLKNPRCIILAVVSAKTGIRNQISLQRIRMVDPHGLRTLGIITKPDTLAEGSEDEGLFISLSRNEDVKLSLGWHVLRNLDSVGSKDQGCLYADLEPLFFKESHFSCVPENRVGIDSLRTRLSKILFNQVQPQLPRLLEGIESSVSAARSLKDKLGPSRAEHHEQRSFLISLSQSFQGICQEAVRGEYNHDFFQNETNPDKRLCTNIRNLHFEFAKNMRTSGASWTIVDKKSDDAKCRTRGKAIREASKVLKRSRGRELPGLPNPQVVGELFRQYSRPWESLARLHIKTVWEATNRFLELAIRYLTDDDTCEKVFRFWIYPIMEENLNTAYDKLNELLEVHKDHPMTTNHQFLQKKAKPSISQAQIEELLKPESLTKFDQRLTIDEVSRLLSNIGIREASDMHMAAAEEAFDNMNAFYDVALNLFTDNVPTLAIQAPIVRAIPQVFCPTLVFSMDKDLIQKIAGESEEKLLERDANLCRLKILEKGARVCKQYAKRPQSSHAALGGKRLVLESLGRVQEQSDERSTGTFKGLTVVPMESVGSTPSNQVSPLTTPSDSKGLRCWDPGYQWKSVKEVSTTAPPRLSFFTSNGNTAAPKESGVKSSGIFSDPAPVSRSNDGQLKAQHPFAGVSPWTSGVANTWHSFGSSSLTTTNPTQAMAVPQPVNECNSPQNPRVSTLLGRVDLPKLPISGCGS